MACHQIVEEGFKWSGDNTISVVSIFLSGLLVYVLGVCRENKQEKNRRNNLLSGLKSELDVNRFFAQHNKGIAQRKNDKPDESDNFILYRNASADEVLSYANIHLADEQREKIMNYLGVVEHANSIIKNYQDTKIRQVKSY